MSRVDIVGGGGIGRSMREDDSLRKMYVTDNVTQPKSLVARDSYERKVRIHVNVVDNSFFSLSLSDCS